MKIKNKSIDNTGGLINRLFQIKMIIAIITGKTLLSITRLVGRGGTTLPGRIAQKIYPGLTGQLAGQLSGGSLVITGTNGKTTTAALISAILKEAGYKCIHNQSGSNMSWGVASALLGSASWTGKIFGECAVMEVDEGAFPAVVKNIKPRGVVATNIFRDQLDRYGEIDLIRNSIQKGIDTLPEGSFQVINADDPSLVGINYSPASRRWTYGMELDLPASAMQNTGRDIKICPQCHHTLAYERIYYAHLGHYHCSSCSYRRPDPDVSLTGRKISREGSAILEINAAGEKLETVTQLPGLYNLYNILAAVTAAIALAVPTVSIIRALEKTGPAFGRMEFFKIDEKTLFMALIKNPVGANEVIKTILEQKKIINLLIAINDRIADGTDVSWLWDVDFEQLAGELSETSTVLVSGQRAWDMALRLKYAGLDPSYIQVMEDTAGAVGLGLEQTGPGENLFILPTYTAMLEIRRCLNKRGMGRPYWES